MICIYEKQVAGSFNVIHIPSKVACIYFVEIFEVNDHLYLNFNYLARPAVPPSQQSVARCFIFLWARAKRDALPSANVIRRTSTARKKVSHRVQNSVQATIKETSPVLTGDFPDFDIFVFVVTAAFPKGKATVITRWVQPNIILGNERNLRDRGPEGLLSFEIPQQEPCRCA